MKWLSWAWEFAAGLSSGTWLIVAAVAGFAAWTGFVWEEGRSSAQAECRTAALEAKIRKLELEAKIQTEADALDDKFRAELEAENARYEKAIDDYAEEVRGRAGTCLLGADAARLQ